MRVGEDAKEGEEEEVPAGGRAEAYSGSAPAKASQAPPPAVPQRSTGGVLGNDDAGFRARDGVGGGPRAIHGAVRSFSGGSRVSSGTTKSRRRAGRPRPVEPSRRPFGLYAGQRGEMTMCQYYFDAMQKCKIGGDNLQY